MMYYSLYTVYNVHVYIMYYIDGAGLERGDTLKNIRVLYKYTLVYSIEMLSIKI